MKTESEQAPPAPNPNKKHRKDRGTRRVSLPAWLVKDLEAVVKAGEYTSLEGLLVETVAREQRPKDEERVTLPPSVQARLAPAVAATGRSVSDLLLDFEGDLCGLLDGSLVYRAPGSADTADLLVPGLEERLVTAFRERLRAVTTPSPEPPAEEVVDLMGAIKESLAKGRP